MKQLHSTSIMDKKQILENIYNSFSVADDDKNTIEKIFTAMENGIKTSILDEKINSIIRKYRPKFFPS